MGVTSIDGNLLRKLIIAGANELYRNRHDIDALNVFPVPDGDTGTNMSMTVMAAAREVANLRTPNIYDVAKAASNGSLRGARGNSGVILSQLFRGFAKGLENVAVADADNLAFALTKASETAYKAVMKPKEGTMLTVGRAIGEYALEMTADTDDIDVIFEALIKNTRTVLAKTTNMLPELKQAGVVDAGGKGLLLIFEGAFAKLHSTEDIQIELSDASTPSPTAPAASHFSPTDIKFIYCTEFIVDIPPTAHKQGSNNSLHTEDELKRFLSGIGDSVVVVMDDALIKVHVHTNNPGKALEKALTYGSLSNIKIENMRNQHTGMLNFSSESQPVAQPVPVGPPKEIGFVAVSAGSGLSELFTSLGADYIVEGGQTMNPSTEDILAAINAVNAHRVFVLSNNKNIVLAAQQAAMMLDPALGSSKTATVIPTTTIPQGISCMISYSDADDASTNEQTMKEAMAAVRTGMCTVAVRDTTLNDMSITEGDFLFMEDGEITAVDADLQTGAKALLKRMLEDGGDVVSIYYGADSTEDAAREVAEDISEAFPDTEIEIYNGGQPVYHYIFSVE